MLEEAGSEAISAVQFHALTHNPALSTRPRQRSETRHAKVNAARGGSCASGECRGLAITLADGKSVFRSGGMPGWIEVTNA